MIITYDEKKNQKNITERRLSFDRVVDFNFASASFFTDDRADYNEVRIIAIGYLDKRLHVLCFTETSDGFRIISLRKANNREIIKYDIPKTINR